VPSNYCKKKGHYASKCFKKQKEAGIKRIEAEPQTDTGNDTNSDTDEYDTAKIELVNNLGMREKPSLMRSALTTKKFCGNRIPGSKRTSGMRHTSAVLKKRLWGK
jgi:hypothetical protein